MTTRTGKIFEDALTVKKLRESLDNLPDDMVVGGSGHFGEYLEVQSAEKGNGVTVDGNVEVFLISIESPGEDPN